MQEEKLIFTPKQLETLVVGDLTFRSCNDHRLTNKDLEEAFLDLGETEEKKTSSLRQLRENLSRDKDLNYRSDDNYLLRFLRFRKFDVEKTYHMVRKVYALRKERPDIFDLPPNFESLLNYSVMSCLPYRHEDGNIIFWVDTTKWKLEEISLWEVLNAGLAVSDIITMNPSCQIHGVIALYDFGGMTARHLAQYVYPSTLRTLAQCLQETYPWRIRRIIFVNCNSIFRAIYSVFRHFLKKKIADRILILGSDLSELHQHVNPRILPKVYGGCIETSECNFAQIALDNVKYLKYERSFGPIPKS